MVEPGGADRERRDPTDWDSGNPVDRIEGTGQDEGNAIQFSWWNLLLLVPLLMLITPLVQQRRPELFGMPYLLLVPVRLRLRRRGVRRRSCSSPPRIADTASVDRAAGTRPVDETGTQR